MISIRELIASSNSDVRAAREIAVDRRIQEMYSRYPELGKIDRDIVAARATGLIAVIDNNIVEQKHSKALESQLRDKRERFIARNDIDPHFDEERIICETCEDTGFYKNKSGMMQVCKCRQSDVEECYRLSGLKDYSLVKLENYKDDHFGNKNHRIELRREMVGIVVGKNPQEGSSISILSDGVQTGKTFLAVYIVKLAINLGHSAYYTRLDDLALKYDDELDDYRNVELLVIDDYIANMTMQGMLGTRLNSILESRLAKGLPVIIVSSFPVSSLVADSDVRIASKLKKAHVIAGDKGKTK